MSESQKIGCQELVELVTEYLEGKLEPGEAARFEQHVQECLGCGAYLGQMRETVRALGRLGEEALPPQVQEELLRVFRNWKHN